MAISHRGQSPRRSHAVGDTPLTIGDTPCATWGHSPSELGTRPAQHGDSPLAIAKRGTLSSRQCYCYGLRFLRFPGLGQRLCSSYPIRDSYHSARDLNNRGKKRSKATIKHSCFISAQGWCRWGLDCIWTGILTPHLSCLQRIECHKVENSSPT